MEIVVKSISLKAEEKVLSNDMDYPWSFDQNAELVYCKEGKVRVIAPDGYQAFVLSEGQGVFIVPKTLNRILSSSGPSTIIVISFPPTLLWQDSTSSVYTTFVAPLMNSSEGLISLSHISAGKIEEIFDSIKSTDYGFEISVRDAISEIALILIREKGSSKSRKNEIKSERLIRMVEFIKANYEKDITLSEIAEAGMVSNREALRTFSSSLGESPIHYLIGYRLSEGAKLLEKTDLNIDQIAEKVGFGTSSHFSKLFKRSYSLSPSQYRRWILKS